MTNKYYHALLNTMSQINASMGDYLGCNYTLEELQAVISYEQTKGFLDSKLNGWEKNSAILDIVATELVCKNMHTFAKH
jgi:hypothetical protein